MALSIEDINDNLRFRLLLRIPYGSMIDFVLDHLRKRSVVTVSFIAICVISLITAFIIRISQPGLSGYFLYSLLGFIIFPVLIIPVHELLHIIPYYITGARDIRIGMDLKQYMFYVTAHRYIAGPSQFISVALFPFMLITIASAILVYVLPDLWKWCFATFLFTHATMCAGDFALVNFYYINREKKIFTWDDADKKEAYFYEEIK